MDYVTSNHFQFTFLLYAPYLDVRANSVEMFADHSKEPTPDDVTEFNYLCIEPDSIPISNSSYSLWNVRCTHENDKEEEKGQRHDKKSYIKDKVKGEK